MKITATTNVNVEEWDDLAAAMGGGYFHCHAEVQYDAAVTDTAPLFVKAVDDLGQCLGVTTGTIAISRVWPFSRHCNYAMLLCLPAVGDRSVETERAIMAAIEEHLRRKGVFSIHVYSYDSPRSEAVLSSLGYDLSARSEFHVDLTRSLDDIWAGFKGHRRTDVRKAEKLGIVTRVENTPEALDLVLSFQAQSMGRRGKSMPSARERTILARRDRLESGRVDVLVSYRDETPVNAALFGFFNGRAYYHVSGSSDPGYECCGPVHLIWTAIRIYKDRGATCLNLGAALEDQGGLFRFKQDFGATVVSTPVGKKRISRVGSGLHRIRSLLRG